jgi:hypothetical protein
VFFPLKVLTQKLRLSFIPGAYAMPELIPNFTIGLESFKGMNNKNPLDLHWR